MENETETKKHHTPPDPASCPGVEDAARRDRAVDDSIESTVAALKRVHCASALTAGLGGPEEPTGQRSLLYDIVDINARYLRQMLGIAARANDQLADLFGYAYSTPGALEERSIELKLKRDDDHKLARGLFRLRNATNCEVNVDFPASVLLHGGGIVGGMRVDLTFSVHVVGRRDDQWETLCSSAVPANGALDVELTLPTNTVETGTWRGETLITTDATHDLGLVIELPAS